MTLTQKEQRDVPAIAAGTGHLGCLKVLFAWEYFPEENTWAAAAGAGHLHTLRYLRQETEGTCSWIATESCASAGHLECLKYLHSIDARWDLCVANSTAAAGQLACLAYLVENGCRVDASTCAEAALNGHVECLRYLRSRGCPWDINTTWDAALNGHLWCLSFAVEEGCPINDYVFADTIEGCHVDCVEYLLWAGHRPKHPLKLRHLESDAQMRCLARAALYGRIAVDAGQLVLLACLGNLKLVRAFHRSRYPLWGTALDVTVSRRLPPDASWDQWAESVREPLSSVWRGVLHVPPSDEHLRACWGTLRFGSVHGAPLTPRAEALVRERRACAQEVVRCLHAARWRVAAGGPHAGNWAAMSRVPLDVLMTILELAEVEIYEAAR